MSERERWAEVVEHAVIAWLTAGGRGSGAHVIADSILAELSQDSGPAAIPAEAAPAPPPSALAAGPTFTDVRNSGPAMTKHFSPGDIVRVTAAYRPFMRGARKEGHGVIIRRHARDPVVWWVKWYGLRHEQAWDESVLELVEAPHF